MDSETGWYYMRNRQYIPQIYRFASRDLIWGDYQQPLTLHKYLYCGNDPINRLDPSGLSWLEEEWYQHLMKFIAWMQRGRPGEGHYNTQQTLEVIEEATDLVGRWWQAGPILAFAVPGYYDYKDSGSTFRLGDVFMRDSQFGNYLAGYTCYYNYFDFGDLAARS
ncbi:MAG: RHS repeat-associated core domain-containing protein, partial [Planctomycetota bacterium]